MPSRSAGLAAATTVTVVTVLAGCSGKTPAPLSSARPMTMAAYEQVLTGIDKGLSSDFQRLSSAQTPAAVSAAAADAEGDVARDLAILSRATPPARFQTGNAAMISALTGFD